MKLLVALALVCVCSAATIEQQTAAEVAPHDWTKPSFCNNLDCPEFTVISKTTDYELRQYKTSRWVKTRSQAMDPDNSRRIMFNKLFQYISGNNERNEKVAMTAPVVSRVKPGDGPACESYFTMGFFIADKIAATAPKPSEATVYLETEKPKKFYVRSYSGYATTESNLKEVIALEAAIPKEAKVDRSFWFTAGYDSPFKPFNRHNEVWLQVIED